MVLKTTKADGGGGGYLPRKKSTAGNIVRPMPVGCARARNSSEAPPNNLVDLIFFVFLKGKSLVKNKKILDLQVSSRIGKTMKKLQ